MDRIRARQKETQDRTVFHKKKELLEQKDAGFEERAKTQNLTETDRLKFIKAMQEARQATWEKKKEGRVKKKHSKKPKPVKESGSSNKV